MNSYWPKGLDLCDVQSPDEILKNARDEWDKNSDGVLTLVFQNSISQDKNAMIIVHAKHIPSNRTATLFTVIHRPIAPYPATILIISEALPYCLKREYYRPGMQDSFMPLDLEGETVTNPWVSETPAEFRTKLSEAFNQSIVKTIIFGLATGEAPASENDNQQS